MSENPFSIVAMIAERRIAEAQKAGEFDNLPGQGRPIVLEDDSNIPPELRLGYKLLKNAGYVPPEIAERREIGDLLDALEKGGEEREKMVRMRRLDFLILRASMRSNRAISLDMTDPYYEKALDRLGRIKAANKKS